MSITTKIIALKLAARKALDPVSAHSLLHSTRVHSALLRADSPSPSSPTDRPHPLDCPTTAVHHRHWLRGMSYAPLKRMVLPRIYHLHPSRLRLSRALHSLSARSGYMPLFSIYISRSVWGLPVEDLLTLTALPLPTSIPMSRIRLGSIPWLNLANVKHVGN